MICFLAVPSSIPGFGILRSFPFCNDFVAVQVKEIQLSQGETSGPFVKQLRQRGGEAVPSTNEFLVMLFFNCVDSHVAHVLLLEPEAL